MLQPKIIWSLHRPYQKPLKSIKWVCKFVSLKRNTKIKPSTFYYEFFFYFISQLKKEYLKSTIVVDRDGVPSKETIFSIVEFFSKIEKTKKEEKLKQILLNREIEIDRKIYSTYKAISYYINLAKEKLEFIDEKYSLTDSGERIINVRSSFFELNKEEKLIIFEKLFAADALMLISKCFGERLLSKNKVFISNLHIKFIEDVYQVTYFKYTQSSLISNYDNVRSNWIEQLNILDSFSRIRKSYLKIILDNQLYTQEYNDIEQKFLKYSKEILHDDNKNHKLMKEFNQTYKSCLKKNINDLGFVNLHSIRSEMKMGIQRFEKLLVDYYELNRRKEMILFSNTVSSIDKGQRFYVKDKPVIKIKII